VIPCLAPNHEGSGANERGNRRVGCSRAAGCSFVDERLNKRLHKLVAQIGSAMGQSIPLVCQDWANTKAAYRFLSNDEQRPLSARSSRSWPDRDPAGIAPRRHCPEPIGGNSSQPLVREAGVAYWTAWVGRVRHSTYLASHDHYPIQG